MARVKSKNTTPERNLCHIFRRERLRFRRHVAHLPGKPDFVLREAPVIVFVDGDFWHGRELSTWAHKLSPYWLGKISRNIRRDKSNFAKLRRLGWSVLRVWESDLAKSPLKCIAKIRSAIVRKKRSTQMRVVY